MLKLTPQKKSKKIAVIKVQPKVNKLSVRSYVSASNSKKNFAKKSPIIKTDKVATNLNSKQKTHKIKNVPMRKIDLAKHSSQALQSFTIPRGKINPRRLSLEVMPSYYEIEIKTDIDSGVFSGKEKITLLVNQPHNSLTLHSLDTKISSVIWQQGRTKLECAKVSFNQKSETATFVFPKQISGKGHLHLQFEGRLNNLMKGFYKSNYTHDGKNKAMAVTQFEATDARRAFPCFDEPAQKAVFDVTCIVPKNLTVISNTQPIATVTHSGGFKAVKFAPTPKMSTYLLAIIAGDLDNIKTRTKNGTIIRVFTAKGKKHQAAFALEVAKRSLEFLENYFDIKFNLPVLDLIAIPDFSAGAMENWGAITFREATLLIDDQNSSEHTRQYVAEVIAHELVHQWFGNLVTMEWWTHLWLNESFANFMSYVVLDELYPEWHVWTKFVLFEQTRALELDSLKSTHAIEVEVKDASEISQIFDAISYSKGGSVLRMLSHYIGPENFRKALQLYLKKHSFKNTSSVHLWEAFSQASGKDIEAMMKVWTLCEGYPLIEVRNQNDKLIFSQSRFSFDELAKTTIWPVPIQTRVSKNIEIKNIFLEKAVHEAEYPEKIYNHTDFVKVNDGEIGFFRVKYSMPILAKNLLAIKHGMFKPVDSLGFYRDLFELVKHGDYTADVYLEAIQYLNDYSTYVVWEQIINDVLELSRLISLNVSTKKYLTSIFERALRQIGISHSSKDTVSRSMLRASLLGVLSRLDNEMAINECKKLFTNHLKNGLLHPNYRSVVYSAVARVGNNSDLDALLKLYKKTDLHEEQKRLAVSVAKFGPKQKRLVLEFIFSDQIRAQDLPFVIYSAMFNPNVQNETWQKIKSAWGELQQKLGPGSLTSSLIAAIASFKSEELILDAEKFFLATSHRGSEMAVSKALERARINSKLIKNNTESLKFYKPPSLVFSKNIGKK